MNGASRLELVSDELLGFGLFSRKKAADLIDEGVEFLSCSCLAR